MAENATGSGNQSEPSEISAGTSLGLPSADEIESAVKRMKERMVGSGGPDKTETEDGSGQGSGNGRASAADEAVGDGARPATGDPAGEAPADEGQGESSDGSESREEGKRTLKETADSLKTSAKSLYEMEVPLNDGSGRYLSVEDLKAGYLAGEAGTLDAERHEFNRDKALHEAERIEHENRVLASTRELQGILALVTKALPPDQLRAYRQQAMDRAAVEAQRLQEAMPQFRDRNVYQGWMKDATGLLSGYGFSIPEATNIADHRIYKLLDDHMRLKARVAALETIPPNEAKPPKVVRRQAPGRSDGKAAKVEKARQTRDRGDQVTAVKALIGIGQ